MFAVGRPELTRFGRWIAAVLACGPGALLSHGSAAALWEIGEEDPGWIDVSVPCTAVRRLAGVRAHRRRCMRAGDRAELVAIPVTSPVRTLVDLGVGLSPARLEAAINAADKHDRVDPESLRSALEPLAGQPGVARLRSLLDRRTFTLTDSELERRFLPLAREAGLPPPRTRAWVNGFRVDFHWPALGLVVETDGLRYHRTPSQQARDRRRDQVHTAAGLTPLRFTHAEVAHEPAHVRRTLARVACLLTSSS